MTNKEWLKSLKAGDKVFVVREYWGRIISKNIRCIDSITTTKQLVIGNMTFTDGEIPHGHWATEITYLEEVTEQSYKEFREQKYIKHTLKQLKELTAETLTLEQAQAIAKIMGWSDKI